MYSENVQNVIMPVRFVFRFVLDTTWCVTYKQNETCGFKGSSVEIPCSYPNNTDVTKIFWSTHWDNQQDLSQDAAYSGRTKYLRRTSNDCTLRLADLKESDTSYYYVTYHFNYFSGVKRTCVGFPGVWLHIFLSAVDVLVQQFDDGQRLAVAGQKVTEGQRIILTCVPTCAETLNSRLTYIWYKNGLKLSGGSAKENFLHLDPISNEDTGSYSCAMIGHEDLPSPAVNLSVQYGPRNTTLSVEISSDGTEKGSVMTLTCSSDANPPVHEYTWYKRSGAGEEVVQRGGREAIVLGARIQHDDTFLCEAVNSISGRNSTAHNLKKHLKATVTTHYTFYIILVASACAGLVVLVLVAGAFLVHILKKKCTSPVSQPPHRSSGPDTDTYTALDVRFMPPEYEILARKRGCSDVDEDCATYDSKFHPDRVKFHQMSVMSKNVSSLHEKRRGECYPKR